MVGRGGTAGVCGVGLGWLDGVAAGRRCVGGPGTAVGMAGDTLGMAGAAGDTAGAAGNTGGAARGAVGAVGGTVGAVDGRVRDAGGRRNSNGSAAGVGRAVGPAEAGDGSPLAGGPGRGTGPPVALGSVPGADPPVAVGSVPGAGSPVAVGSGPAVGSALVVGSVPDDGPGTWVEAERVAVGSVGGVGEVGGMGSPVGAGAGEGVGVGVGVGVTVGGGGRVGTRSGGRWTASGSDRSEAAGTIGAGAGGGRPGPGSPVCGAAAVPAGVEGATAGWPVAGTITGPTERVGMNGVLLSGSAVLPTVADPVLMAARIGMEAVPASRATVKRYPRPGPPEPGARCAPTTRR
ncbi:hypothetical protein [Micromonospora haikouensis]|uniref:hypothetical protein n=1 Tax=Micromonospora haikouensis TaxID=686309 RepID=UPI003D91EBDA